ncbi:MAG: class I SAM-dependent methyltransferase [Nitrospinae bacterium]|nr:class I SAM-dependent methyltransferase [Nitrospinota bacterium]
MNLIARFYREEEPLRGLVRDLIRDPRASVLDLGCRKGEISRSLAESAGRATALDKVYFEDWKIPAPGLRFVNGDALALPFKDESFDKAVSCECLQYLDDPQAALREIHRVLKPGGMLALTFPEGNWTGVFFDPYRLSDAFLRALGLRSGAKTHFRPPRLKEVLAFSAPDWETRTVLRRGTLLFKWAAWLAEKLCLCRSKLAAPGLDRLAGGLFEPAVGILFAWMKFDFSLSLSSLSYNNILLLRKKTGGRAPCDRPSSHDGIS